MAEVVEGAGEVQEGGGGPAAAAETCIDLAGWRLVPVFVDCVPRAVGGVDQSGQGILGAVTASEGMLAGVDLAGGVRAYAAVHDPLGHLRHDRCKGDGSVAPRILSRFGRLQDGEPAGMLPGSGEVSGEDGGID